MKKITLFLISLFPLFAAAQEPTLKRINLPANKPALTTGAACCGFRAMNSSDIPMSLSAAKENVVLFDKEIFDDGNAFNNQISYKAPSAGVYQFTVTLGAKAKNTSSSINQLMLRIKTSGSQSAVEMINIPGNYDDVLTAQLTAVFKLAAGEEVSVVVIGLGSATASTTGNLSYFSGLKLY
jgi:hypothetical protein